MDSAEPKKPIMSTQLTPEQEVEQYLDKIDLERMEWQRLQDDMYPGIKPERDED